MMKTISRAAAAASLAALLWFPAAAAATPGRLFDSQIIGILTQLDESATEEAQAAAGRARDMDVRAFANLVISDHLTTAQHVGALGIAPEETEARSRLRRQANEAAGRLQRLDGGALDRAYLSVAAERLTAAIDDLDHRLMPDAVNPALIAHLRERRYLIMAHFARARELKARLEAK